MLATNSGTCNILEKSNFFRIERVVSGWDAEETVLWHLSMSEAF